MKSITKKENIVFSIGGMILIVLIFSGWKGMLAAGLVLAWLLLASKLESPSQEEDSFAPEERRTGKVVRFEDRRSTADARRRMAS